MTTATKTPTTLKKEAAQLLEQRISAYPERSRADVRDFLEARSEGEANVIQSYYRMATSINRLVEADNTWSTGVVKQLAADIEVSEGYLYQIRNLALSWNEDDARRYLTTLRRADGKSLTASHLIQVAMLHHDTKQQKKLLADICRQNYSVRDVQERVKALLAKKRPSRSTASPLRTGSVVGQLHSIDTSLDKLIQQTDRWADDILTPLATYDADETPLTPALLTHLEDVRGKAEEAQEKLAGLTKQMRPIIETVKKGIHAEPAADRKPGAKKTQPAKKVTKKTAKKRRPAGAAA